MTELRSLLLEAEPLDDTGFVPAPGVRATAARRTRRRYAVVGTALAAVLLLVPLALRPSNDALPPVAPPPTPTPSVTPIIDTLEGTQWRVDLRASGITDDPEIAPTSVTEGSGGTGLGAIVLLERDGALSLRNGYAGAGALSAGRYSGYRWESRSPSGDRGWISFTVTAPWIQWGTACGTGDNERCTGGREYWPGVRAFSRLESVVEYELEPVPHGDPVPFGPTIGMSLLDVRGDVVLRLMLVAKDGKPVGDL